MIIGVSPINRATKLQITRYGWLYIYSWSYYLLVHQSLKLLTSMMLDIEIQITNYEIHENIVKGQQVLVIDIFEWVSE